MLDRTSSMLLPSRLKFLTILTAQNLSIVDYPQNYHVFIDRVFGANNYTSPPKFRRHYNQSFLSPSNWQNCNGDIHQNCQHKYGMVHKTMK